MKTILIVGWLVTTSLTFQSTWYGDSFNGNRTFNGEIFDENKMTAASNHFAIGTKLKVTNKANGKSVIVRINDRGNMSKYTIDLSKAAFKRIADLKTGVIDVKVKVIK
jgi:rare lipoprotein A